jgi:hypothetical protein
VELDDAAWALLHELRLRGTVEGGGDEHLETLVARGFAVRKRTLAVITADGRTVHARWARCVAGSPEESTVRSAYERFLPINSELLRLCHDWQVTPAGAPNVHTDLEYDWAVVERLRSLHERTGPIARSLARALDRFGGYRPRLADALRRVDAGDLDWFTSPRLDSYHTVWMQLHEDLLLALGLDRATEATA